MLSLVHMSNTSLLNQVLHPQGDVPLVAPATGSELALSAEAFLRSLVGKNRSAQTLRAYRSDLGQFLTWLAETNDVARHPGQITRADIEAYLTDLGHQGLSGVSRARKLAAIRGYFAFLVNHEVIPRSPAAGVDAPRRERRQRPYPRSEEYNQLLSLAGAKPRDYAMLQVFLQTGVRVSELVNLTLDDIDLAGRMLTVRGGKGMADREIELEKRACAALKTWLAARPRSFSDHLFLNYKGEPLSERSVRRLVADYTAHAGLAKKVSPHTLRRTFATAKHRRGVPLRQVQEWLGHKNVNTTQIYVQVERQDAHKVMEATSL